MLVRSLEPRRFPLVVTVFAAVAACLLLASLWSTPQTMWLLRDQMRDWTFALGSFRDLPLTGTQSTAGGSSFGPIFYWLLWLSRVVIGPFTDHQPHAGAIGLALVQTVGDVAFMYAVWKRWQSVWLAAALTILVATAPHIMAIESTIWNPTVSVAFVKLAVAAALIEPAWPSLWHTALTTTLAWLAVQAHTAAIFVAAPLVGSYVLRDLASVRLKEAAQRLRTIAEVVLVLQIPFIYHALTTTEAGAPTRALAGVAEGLHLTESAHAMFFYPARILAAPFASAQTAVGVIGVLCLLVALIRARADLRMLSASILPIACGIVGFAAWQGAYDEYWFLPMMPCVALVVGEASSVAGPERIGVPLLAAVLALQPWRVPHAHAMYSMPEYYALSKGSRTIYRQLKAVRSIDTSFPMPPFSDSEFVYRSMGGRIADDAEFEATIAANGDVRFKNRAQ